MITRDGKFNTMREIGDIPPLKIEDIQVDRDGAVFSHLVTRHDFRAGGLRLVVKFPVQLVSSSATQSQNRRRVHCGIRPVDSQLLLGYLK